jgi:hypothetical protein
MPSGGKITKPMPWLPDNWHWSKRKRRISAVLSDGDDKVTMNSRGRLSLSLNRPTGKIGADCPPSVAIQVIAQSLGADYVRRILDRLNEPKEPRDA